MDINAIVDAQEVYADKVIATAFGAKEEHKPVANDDIWQWTDHTHEDWVSGKLMLDEVRNCSTV